MSVTQQQSRRQETQPWTQPQSAWTQPQSRQQQVPATPTPAKEPSKAMKASPPTAQQHSTASLSPSSGGSSPASNKSSPGSSNASRVRGQPRPTNFHGREQPPNRPEEGTAGRKIMIRANFFPIKLPEQLVIYHYDVTISPEKMPKSCYRKVRQNTTCVSVCVCV